MDLAIKKQRIKALKKGFAILDSNILPRWCTDERCDEIYDTVSRYCILKGTIPPPMDKDYSLENVSSDSVPFISLNKAFVLS